MGALLWVLPWCSLAGLIQGPNVFVEAMALAGRACRLFFHLREEAQLSFVIMPLTPRFFPPRACVCGFGFGFCLRVCATVMPSSFAEYVGQPRLSLMRICMKSFFSGRARFCPGHSFPLTEPGTRQHRFLEYTDMSSIGLPLMGHFMRGSVITFFHILSRTKFLIPPRALSVKVTSSAYKCQLFFHMCFLFTHGRPSLSKVNEHGFGRQLLIAALRIWSLSSVVGSSSEVSESHSMSK